MDFQRLILFGALGMVLLLLWPCRRCPSPAAELARCDRRPRRCLEGCRQAQEGQQEERLGPSSAAHGDDNTRSRPRNDWLQLHPLANQRKWCQACVGWRVCYLFSTYLIVATSLLPILFWILEQQAAASGKRSKIISYQASACNHARTVPPSSGRGG